MGLERSGSQPSPKTEFNSQWTQTVEDFLNVRCRTLNSAGAYRGDLRILKDFLGQRGVHDWSQVTPDLLIEFVDNQKRACSEATLNRRLSALRGFFGFLSERDHSYTRDCPAKLNKTPQFIPAADNAYKNVPLTNEQKDKVYRAAADSRDRALYQLLIHGFNAGTIEKAVIGDLEGDVDDFTSPLKVSVKSRKHGRTWITEATFDPKTATDIREYLIDQRQADLKDPQAPLIVLTRQGIWLRVKSWAEHSEIQLSPRRLSRQSRIRHEPIGKFSENF